MSVALEIAGMNVTLGGRGVLSDVSLAFDFGGTYAVVGRSGAGKSVLMKAACGFLAHDGTVSVHTRPLVFVHQDPALLDDLDVEENVAFAVSRTRLPPHEVVERVRDAMARVGLDDVRHALPARLPLATQKRVALARALALQPAVLIVDEPTTGLDPIAAETVDGTLSALARTRALTLIVITHSPRTRAALAPRLVVVEGGHARLAERS